MLDRGAAELLPSLYSVIASRGMAATARGHRLLLSDFLWKISICGISHRSVLSTEALSQLYRERRSGETRFSTEADSMGRTADSSTPLRSGRNDTLKKNEYSNEYSRASFDDTP